MRELAIIPDESKALIDEALGFCESVVEITISNDNEYTKACGLTRQVQDYTKKIDAERKSLLRPFKESTDCINDAFRPPQNALDNLKSKLRDSIGTYNQMLEQKRLTAQRKADETARVERKRLEDEAKAKEEKAAALVAEGKTDEAQAQAAKAESIMQVAETITAPKIETKAPIIEGVHTRDKYTGELIDKRAFIEYALDNGVYYELITINMPQIDKMIQAAKGNIIIPGIRVHVEKVPVFR